MAYVSESITIARPVEAVFAFAGDYRNDPQWRHGVTEMTVSPDSEIELGSNTREVINFMGKQYITEARVVGWTPNQQTAFKSFAASIPVEGKRLFEHDLADTRFTYTVTFNPQTLSDKLMVSVLAIVFRRQTRQDLKRLKTMLEQN